MINRQELKTFIQKMGVAEREVEIITYLMGIGRCSVSEISKNVNIPRSSIYRHIDILEKKGWLKYSLTKQGKEIELTDLASLQAQIVAKKEQIAKEELFLGQLIEQAKTNREKDGRSEQTVRYYEGESGMRQIHWNATYTTKGAILVITSIITRALVGDEWYETQLVEAQSKGVPIKILVDQRYAKEFFEKYQSVEQYYKPLPDMSIQIDKRVLKNTKFNVNGKIMIYNNIVASMAQKGGVLFGSEIVSDELSATFKSIFDVLWGLTEPKDRLGNDKGF
jgi:sugar-specific transcriptional regulator TrmB